MLSLKSLKKISFTILINIVLTIPIIYTVQIFLAFREYNLEFGEKAIGYKSGKSKDFSYDPDHPLQVSNFPDRESIKDFFKKKKGTKLYERLSPGALKYTNGININKKSLFPLTSFSNTDILFGHESGFWITYKSDNFGFRNPQGTWKNDNPDILFLGDSFTHGAYVEEKDTFSGVARNQGFSTINLGIGGTGPLLQLAAYREYVTYNDVKPKILAWVFFAEDIRDLVAEFKSSSILRNYLEEDNYNQRLVFRKDEIEELLRIYQNNEYPMFLKEQKEKRAQRKKEIQIGLIRKTIKLFHLKRLIKHQVSTLSNPNKEMIKEPNTELMLELFNDVIKSMKKESEKTNSKLVFIYLPTWSQFGNNVDSYGINTQSNNYLIKENILKTIKDKDIDLIDLTIKIKEKGKDKAGEYYNYNRYGHFNPNGYNSVAKYISEQLKTILEEN